VLAAILADARATPWLERCGLLLGHGNRISAHLPAHNVAAMPTCQFELDPAALLAAHKRTRAGGAAIMGHYHNHPDGLDRPSPHDAEAAGSDGQLWLIVTMTNWSLWRAEARGPLHGAFVPVDLHIDGSVKALPATGSPR
jgi:proteasome lid subunit RPN8/RPN11